MNRKGLSPVVAVVLLIVASISMGIMVTTWVTHWISSQTGSESISCAINTNYLIEDAIFNKSGNNTLRIKLLNKGAQDLYGFGAVLDNGTRIVRINSTNKYIDHMNISEFNPLKREQTMYLLVNLTNETLGYPWLGGTLEEVRIVNDACDTVSAKTTEITIYTNETQEL